MSVKGENEGLCPTRLYSDALDQMQVTKYHNLNPYSYFKTDSKHKCLTIFNLKFIDKYVKVTNGASGDHMQIKCVPSFITPAQKPLYLVRKRLKSNWLT